MDGLMLLDELDYETPVVSPFRCNPYLLKVAGLYAGDKPYPYQKSAIVPAGSDPSMGDAPPPGGPPPDPSMGGAPPDPSMGGGAPPPDPSAGGGAPPAPIDPTLVQSVAQAVMQQLGSGGAGGAAGGMAGKPPKKAEDAIRDAKIYAIDVKLTALLEHFNIQLPASVTLGNPPDPNSQQAATQEHQTASMVASDPNSAPPPPPGPPGMAPMGGMDASSGPIGKAASFGDPWPIENPVVASYGPTPSMATRMRQLMGS